MSGLTLVTGATIQHVALDEVKDHARIEDVAEESYVFSLIYAAIEKFEHDTGRKLITQTWDYVLDTFPDSDTIYLPYSPLQSVTSVKYQDSDDAEQTLSSDYYTVDTDSMVGRIVLDADQTWPTINDDCVNEVVIRFVCGYGDNWDDVPDAARHAIRFLVSHWYEAREPIIVGTSIARVPETYEALMWQHRVGFPT